MKLSKYILSLFYLAALSGCDSAVDYAREVAPSTTRAVEREFEELIDILQEKGLIDKTVSSAEEIKKLYQIEYNIIEVDEHVSVNMVELELNAMGKNRWDCFYIHPINDKDGNKKLRIYCKRGPDTPLRYVPRTILR